MYNIRLKIDWIKAIGTTKSFLEGDTDEIYFVVTDTTSGGQNAFQKRVPANTTYDISDGQTRTDLVPPLKEFQVSDEQVVKIDVNLAEDDADISGIIGAVGGLITGVAEAITAIAAAPSIIGGIILAVAATETLTKSGADLYKAINEGKDQAVGAITLVVINQKGNLAFGWLLNDGVSTSRNASDYNTAVFEATGGGSNYQFQLRAEILDTLISKLSASLVADSNINLILTGTDAITGTGNDVDNIITGNESDNTLNGLLGNDTLHGNGGSDILIGGEGIDLMFGGIGNDTYVVDNTGDAISESENEGIDTVNTSVSYLLGTNLENLTLTGISAINGSGNTLNNIIIGNRVNNTLDGGTGNDALYGGAGDDTLKGEDGNDILQGEDGNDLLDGRLGNDSMLGGTGDDTYYVDSNRGTITEAFDEGNDSVYSSVSYALGNNLEDLILTGDGAINGVGNSLSNKIT
jgi:Ca2+-binding RTX toxin-like protein